MPTSVELIPQDKSNACWLAASTMMRSWKDQSSYPLSDTLKVLDASGGNFTQTYNADNGLSFADNKKIVQTLDLIALPPASYTIDYFFFTVGSESYHGSDHVFYDLQHRAHGGNYRYQWRQNTGWNYFKHQ